MYRTELAWRRICPSRREKHTAGPAVSECDPGCGWQAELCLQNRYFGYERRRTRVELSDPGIRPRRFGAGSYAGGTFATGRLSPCSARGCKRAAQFEYGLGDGSENDAKRANGP